MASKLLRSVILWLPGSRKGTMSQRIAQNFGFQHLSSGHFLQENIKAHTEVGYMAKQYIGKGLLVPDHVITRLMVSELENRRGQHWLLDGFPRTLAQAEALDSVFLLQVTEHVISQQRAGSLWRSTTMLNTLPD